MSIERGILSKNHVCCSFIIKYYIAISLRQFTKTSNQYFFNLSRASKNWKFTCLFDLCRIKAVLRYSYWKYFHKWTLSEEYKIAFLLKTIYEDIIFIWLSPAIKSAARKTSV